MCFSKQETTKQQCFIYPIVIWQVLQHAREEMAVEKRYLLRATPVLPFTSLFVWLIPCTHGQATSPTTRTCCHFKKILCRDSDRDRDRCMKRTSCRQTRSTTESCIFQTLLSMAYKMGCPTTWFTNRMTTETLNFLVCVHYFHL